MSIDEQPMNVYWSGKRTETSNNFKTNYKGSVTTKSNLPSLGNKTGDMYNVTESGENFVWNGSSWDNLSGDTLKTLNWQKSEKASTVAIYPVPETVLHPVVEFAFTETDPAEGDKSPDNPSTITGVSSVTVTRCETAGVNSTDYTTFFNGSYYGGSVDLATGVMTVTYWGHVFDGTENWEFNKTMGTTTRFLLADMPASENDKTGDNTCSHLVYNYSGALDSPHIYLVETGLYMMVVQSDVASLKSWLAAQFANGTPFIFTYKLATPYTITLTSTQIYSLSQVDLYTPRLNTIYTDAQNVQVGYAKSPIRSEYELTQAIIAIEGGE